MRVRRNGFSIWLRILLGAAAVFIGLGLGAGATIFIAFAKPTPSHAPADMAAPRVWIGDSLGGLGLLDLATGRIESRGRMAEVMTDLAFASDGRLFGITFSDLYEISLHGDLRRIGSHGVPCGNALEIAADGSAYAMGCSDDGLYRLELETGASHLLFRTGWSSAGDLAMIDGRLMLAASDIEASRLLAIDPQTGAIEDRGIFKDDFLALSNVFGLVATDDGRLYAGAGFSSYRVDPSSGFVTHLGDYVGSGFGPVYGWAIDRSAEPLTTRLESTEKDSNSL